MTIDLLPSDLSPLWISLRTAGLATIVTFILGVAAAYGMLGYRGHWKSLIEGIFIAPLMLPPTVVGFLLLLLLGRNGPLGQVIQVFDTTIIFTWYAAVIAAIVVSFPLMYRTALGAFEQIDDSLPQVARTLGASEHRVFWQILIPLAIPGLLAGGILTFARALGEFGATLMLAGNIPGQTQTIPMAIYFAVEAGDTQQAWFWTIAIMTLSLSGLVAVNRWQKRYTRKYQHSHPGHLETTDLVDWGATPAESPFFPVPNSSDPSPVPLTELCVDIEKQMATFHLAATFTAYAGNLGILGGSGSGKSMMLRCIAGVDTPTAGRIVLNGRTLFDAAQRINLPSRQRCISLVFQNYALFPHLTVAQNIAFGLRHFPQTQRRQRVRQQLALVQLQGLDDRYPHQLSGGQQQRVALARALATEPDVLLLDEPFSALDTHLRSQMERQLLHTLATYGGITLFVTHNLEEAYRLCETLVVMSGGKILTHNAKQQIFAHPQTVRVAQLTGCKNVSRAEALAGKQIMAIDWGISLHLSAPMPDRVTHVGIRAHQLHITPQPAHPDNTYACWLAATSETPHRMTLFLKFQIPPVHVHDYHLQVEMFKERWYPLQSHPQPWYAFLDPERLMTLQE